MITKIKKWGNSQGVRIPKSMLDDVFIKENDFIEVTIENDCIIIKANKKRHIPLKERVKNYNGDYNISEWDTGENVGKEVF